MNPCPWGRVPSPVAGPLFREWKTVGASVYAARAMKVGIPKEIYPHEARVAATPETVQRIIKLGFEVAVQAGAGDASALSDATYVEAGATIAPDAAALYRN